MQMERKPWKLCVKVSFFFVLCCSCARRDRVSEKKRVIPKCIRSIQSRATCFTRSLESAVDCELSVEGCVCGGGGGGSVQLCSEIPSRILWRTVPKPQFVLMNASTQTHEQERDEVARKKQSIRVHLQKWHFHSHFTNIFSMVGKFSCLLGYEIRNDMYAKKTYFLKFYLIAWVKSMALLLLLLLVFVASDVLFAVEEAVMMLVQLGMCCALSLVIIFRKSETEESTKFELKLTPESKRHNRLVRSSVVAMWWQNLETEIDG